MSDGLAVVVGPWLLGIALEMFVMGTALVLSIHYLVAVCNTHDAQDTSWRLGVTLVLTSLALSIAQMGIDLDRGWRMFGEGFDNIEIFLTTTILHFVSPFLGILCASICQAFLLRRIVLFLGSLAHLWPVAAHRIARWSLVAVVGAAIALCTAAGTRASWEIWKSGSLEHLGSNESTSDSFHKAELLWLGTSVAVDVLLSSLLCVELFWARRQLAIAGGRMGSLVNSLILVTFHGGFIVTALQVAAMILYQASTQSSFCYMVYLPLPKVYVVTLVLSLSLPLAQASNPSHQQFSLPSIHSTPRVVHPQPLAEEKAAKKRSWRRQLSTLLEKGADGTGWSMAGDVMPTVPRPAHAKKTSADLSFPVSPSTPSDGRRPSVPNSLAPLLRPSRQSSLAGSAASPYAQPGSPYSPTSYPPFTDASPQDTIFHHSYFRDIISTPPTTMAEDGTSKRPLEGADEVDVKRARTDDGVTASVPAEQCAAFVPPVLAAHPATAPPSDRAAPAAHGTTDADPAPDARVAPYHAPAEWTPVVSKVGLLPVIPTLPASLEVATGASAVPGLEARRGFVCEADVGILRYVGGDVQGVQGVIKQRFTDFMVYEVSLAGEVARLKDIGKPVEPGSKQKDKGKGKGKAVEGAAGPGPAASADASASAAPAEAAQADAKAAASDAPVEAKPAVPDMPAEAEPAVSDTPAEAKPTVADTAVDATDANADADVSDLPAALRFAPLPKWPGSTTCALFAHFSEPTIVGLHTLFVEGRDAPPRRDAGWGTRVKDEVKEEEAGNAAAPAAQAEEDAANGAAGKGRGQGRDRGRGRERDRGGRGGRGGGRGGATPWKPEDTREVVSQAIAEKDRRAAAHKIVRELFGGQFDTSAREVDGAQCVVVKWATAHEQKRNAERERGPREKYQPYIHFTLHKTNRETQDCLGHLARLLGVAQRDLSVAGTKDKRAVTVQRVSLRRATHTLVSVWKAANQIRAHAGRRTDATAVSERAERGTRIGDIAYADKQLELGMLRGNQFRITLRNVQAEQADVDRMMTSVRDHGFINYFGMQRFGTSSMPTHVTGLHILRAEWDAAIETLLSLRTGEHPDCAHARLAWLEDGDFKAALERMPRRSVAERAIWEFWAKGGRMTDKVGALACIPRNLRTMYVHAYQSYIWNLTVSERIKLSATEPLVGDIVYADRTLPDDDDADPMPVQRGKREFRINDNSSMREVHVLTAEDIAAGTYTIFDVVMPLPGWNIEYPGGAIGELYGRLLAADGLDKDRMRRDQREYSLPGSYRKMIIHPTDLTWEHIRYTDPDRALVQSDEDALLGLNPPATDDPAGRFRALKIALTLPSSAYATMALREITREETATWHHIGLTRGGEDQAHKGTGAAKVAAAAADDGEAAEADADAEADVDADADEYAEGEVDVALNA
ncbi:multisubstrate pseudouridine synthase 7 [Cryptotrichosporon argae]